jgi:hypothetical protein
MVAEVLVSEDVAAGRNVVGALDEAKFPVEAAFWLYDSSKGRWRLWIGTPRAAGDLQKAYVRVAEILSAVTDRKVLDLPQITLVRPDDRMVQAIRSLISVTDSSDIRLGLNAADGILIEDALVYRTAA